MANKIFVDTTISGTKRIYFTDTDAYIYASSAGALVVAGAVSTTIGVAGDIVLGDGTQRDIRPQTTLKMDLGTTSLWFNEGWIHQLHIQQDVTNVDDTTPTDASLDSIFGTPVTLGRGFIGTVDDASGETNFYLCITTDNSWFYLKMTKAI